MLEPHSYFRGSLLKAVFPHPFFILLIIAGCAPLDTAGGRYLSGGTTLRSPAGLSASSLAGPISTIVIDAGHGGKDPGTQHFGLREKNLVLDMSKRLKGQLQGRGITAVMTRETDQFIPLSERASIANRMRADLFVSVHVNANKSASVSGAEVYYPRESVVSGAAQWPPNISPSDIGFPSNSIKQILWDLVLTHSRSRSRRMASTICRSMHNTLGVSCRPKAAKFVVLRESWMPAVLVEVGYVSNRAEAQRLGQPEYRQAAAEAIAEGVAGYIREQGLQHI